MIKGRKEPESASCDAKHPNGSTRCVRLAPCKVGQAHIGQIGRHWANWWDDSNRPQPPVELEPELDNGPGPLFR